MKGFIFEHWPCLSIIVKVSVAQSCLTLCDPMDCSPPGSSVYGILQARILEWVAFPFSRGSSQPRDRAWVSGIAGGFFIIWATGKLQCYTWWLTVSFNLPDSPVRNTELTSFPNAKLVSQKGKCITQGSMVKEWRSEYQDVWSLPESALPSTTLCNPKGTPSEDASTKPHHWPGSTLSGGWGGVQLFEPYTFQLNLEPETGDPGLRARGNPIHLHQACSVSEWLCARRYHLYPESPAMAEVILMPSAAAVQSAKHTQLCASPWTVAPQAHCPRDSPGKILEWVATSSSSNALMAS